MDSDHRSDDHWAMITPRRKMWRRSEDGAGLVEYMLLASLIAVVCIVSISYFGTKVDSRLSRVGSNIEGPAAP